MADMKRLYVGGLTDGIQQADLSERFKRFGEVTNVEIKIKPDISGTKTFAYLQINITDSNLKKCVQVYNKSRWKGKELQVEVAKENFLDRLKMEQKERKMSAKVSSNHETIRNKVVKSASQGTPVEDMKNWVVGKNGTILPVLYLRDKDKQKVRKRDPSQYLQGHKDLTNHGTVDTTVDSLTWNLDNQPQKHYQDPEKVGSKARKAVPQTSKVKLQRSQGASKSPTTIKKSKATGKNSGTLNSGDHVRKNSGTVEFDSDSDSGLLLTKPENVSYVSSDTEDSSTDDSSSASSEDTDDILSSQIAQTNLAKKTVKHREEAMMSMSDTDLESDNEGSVSLPGWLESDSDSDSDMAHGKPTVVKRGDADLPVKEESNQQKLLKKQSQTHGLKDGVPENNKCAVFSSTEDSTSHGESGSDSEGELKIQDDPQISHSESSGTNSDSSYEDIMSHKGNTTVAGAQSSQVGSTSKLSRTMDKYTTVVLSEYSSGIHSSSKISVDQENNSDMDVFEVIAAGKVGQLYQTGKSSFSDSHGNLSLKSYAKADVGKDSPVIDNRLSVKNKKTQICEKKIIPDSRKDEKRQETANQKRLDSLKQRQKEATTQKLLVQKALSSVDKASLNKKVVFDSDEEDEQPSDDHSSGEDEESAGQEEKSTAKSTKLFASDSEGSSDSDSPKFDDDGERFNIRPEFEGAAGKKLLKLQSRFGNDSRFKLDARFMESASENSDSEGERTMEEKDSVSEKQRSLEILQTVVGSSALMKKKKQSKTTFRDISTLHYDPTKEDHQKFELAEDPKPKKAKKSKSNKKTSEATDSAEPDLPEVSLERFYEVATPLKQVFGKDELTDKDDTQTGFSLLTMFGRDPEPSEAPAEGEDKCEVLPKSSNLFPWQENLEYADSSDEEELHGTHNDTTEMIETAIKTDSTAELSRPETFFFSENDPRIKEGIAFFHCTDDPDKIREKWLEKRPYLVDAYRLKRKRTLRQSKVSHRSFASKRGRKR